MRSRVGSLEKNGIIPADVVAIQVFGGRSLPQVRPMSRQLNFGSAYLASDGIVSCPTITV